MTETESHAPGHAGIRPAAPLGSPEGLLREPHRCRERPHTAKPRPPSMHPIDSSASPPPRARRSRRCPYMAHPPRRRAFGQTVRAKAAAATAGYCFSLSLPTQQPGRVSLGPQTARLTYSVSELISAVRPAGSASPPLPRLSVSPSSPPGPRCCSAHRPAEGRERILEYRIRIDLVLVSYE